MEIIAWLLTSVYVLTAIGLYAYQLFLRWRGERQ
jgi:hypothetical protein